MRAALRILVVVSVAACGGGWTVADGTPPDLAELVTETVDDIEAALPDLVSCLGNVTVAHAWELDDRAEYHTETATVVLRVPATAPELEFSLAHEIAHHLEVACEGQEALRDEFLRAQGHPAGQEWFEGDSWATTPSEQFATAVAELVTGGPDPSRRVAITQEARDVVRRWAGTPAGAATRDASR